MAGWQHSPLTLLLATAGRSLPAAPRRSRQPRCQVFHRAECKKYCSISESPGNSFRRHCRESSLTSGGWRRRSRNLTLLCCLFVHCQLAQADLKELVPITGFVNGLGLGVWGLGPVPERSGLFGLRAQRRGRCLGPESRGTSRCTPAV